MYEIPNVENVRGIKQAKDYPTFCRLLEVKVRRGKTNKDAHITFLKRFLDFDKSLTGREIDIKEIYDEPMPEPDRKSPYEDYLQLLMLNIILRNSANNKHVMRISYKKLLSFMDFINEGFVEYKDNPEKMVEWLRSNQPDDHDIEGCQVSEWHKSITQKTKYQIQSTLDKLSSKHIIFWSKEINYFADGMHYAANDEEVSAILSMGKKYLDFKGYSSMQEVISHNNWGEYQNYISEKIQSNIPNFEYYYKVYKIIYINDIAINKEKDKLIQRLESIGDKLDDVAIETNSIFIKESNKDAKFRKANAEKRKEADVKPKFFDEIRLGDSYITDVEYMNEMFIRKR